jgi:hypothetical protein
MQIDNCCFCSIVELLSTLVNKIMPEKALLRRDVGLLNTDGAVKCGSGVVTLNFASSIVKLDYEFTARL